MRTVLPPLAALALWGCSTPTPEPKEPPLLGTVTLAAGPCLGFCPVYEMRLGPDDRYVLEARENTISPGRKRGALPVGSFRRALEAMERYGFAQMGDAYLPGTEACPERVTETPTVTIARREPEFRKIVAYDTGCLGFAEKDRLDQLTSSLRSIMRIDALVAVGERPEERPGADPADANATIGSGIQADETPIQ